MARRWRRRAVPEMTRAGGAAGQPEGERGRVCVLRTIAWGGRRLGPEPGAAGARMARGGPAAGGRGGSGGGRAAPAADYIYIYIY